MSTPARPRAAGPQRGIATLVGMLRANGYRVGASEASDATRLLLELSAREPELEDASRLRTRLRPVFCKTREEQEKFDAIFDEWAAGPVLSGFGGLTPVLSRAAERESTPRRDRRRRSLVIALVAAVLLAAVVAVWRRDAPAPAPSSVTPPPAVAGDSVVSASPSAAPTVPVAAATADRFVPAARYNRELRTIWVWLLVLLPLVPLLGISLPAMVLSRTRLRRNSDPMVLDPRPLEREARRLVPALRRDTTDRLARHLRSAGLDIDRLARRPVLDVRGTLEATIRNHGIPTLRFSHSRIYPSYLLLVDVDNERDPRGRLFFQWAERLQREKLDVEILFIRTANQDGSPAVVFSPAGRAVRDGATEKPLARLRAPQFGERLIVISDGDPLVDRNGVWHPAAMRARLYRWRDRVVFTPVEPRDWGVREEALERSERAADPGFIVLPLEESALAAWADLVLSGQLSTMELSDPQRFPALLRRGRFDRYLGEEPPDAAEIETLIAQLRIYLGTWGFQWLAACAVTPIVRWELTLLLGQAVLKELPAPLRESDVDEALALNYRRLVRLPWMQQEEMPQWLRVRLLSELPATRHRALQRLVRERLAALSPRPIADGIELNFERPPGERAPIEREHRGGRREAGDPLYLGYMSGMTPEQLVLRAPREWRRWTHKIQMRRPSGVRAWMSRLRDRSTSWWSRLAWRDGLPHHGLNQRTAAVTIALALPITVLLIVAERWPLAADVRFVDNWLFVEKPRAVRPVSDRRVFAVAFSPDGTRIAAAGDGGVQLFDSGTGAPAGRLIGPPADSGYSVAFSPDGRTLAAGLDDGRLWTADTSRGSVTNVWRGHVGEIDSIGFAGGGRRIVSTSVVDGTVLQWNAQTAASARGDLQLPLVATTRVSADGMWLAAGHFNGDIRVWRVDDPTGVRTISAGTQPVVALAFSPSGRQLVFAISGGTLQRVATDTMQLVGEPFRSNTSRVRSIAFSPDEGRLVSAGNDGTLRVWDVEAGASIAQTLNGHTGIVWSVAFSPDGTKIVSGGDDGMRLWEARPADVVGEPLRGHAASIHTLAFSPDGMRLVSGSADGGVRLWDTRRGTQVGQTNMPDLSGRPFSVAFDGGGALYMTGGVLIWPWNPQTQPTIFPLGILSDTTAVAFSPDRARVAVGRSFGRLELWETRGRSLVSSASVRGEVTSLAFAPDSSRFVSGDGGGELRLWDAQTGAAIGEARNAHFAPVSSVVFSGDGTRIASASDRDTFVIPPDTSVRLWDVRTVTPIGERMVGHRRGIMSIAFSRDGARLVSAGRDGTIRIWDARTQDPIGSAIASRLQRVTAVVFSPDGRYIAAASNDDVANPEQRNAVPAQQGSSRTGAGDGNPEIRFWRINPSPAPPVETSGDIVRRSIASALAQPERQALATGASIIAATALVVATRRRRRQAIAREVAVASEPE